MTNAQFWKKFGKLALKYLPTLVAIIQQETDKDKKSEAKEEK